MRARLREATDEAILAAAEKVFAERGLHAAKMEAIASEAGVAVGTLYNHFKDRDALLTSLVDDRREEMLGRLESALENGDGQPFEGQLRLFVEALIQHFEAHEKFLAIIMEGETANPPRMVATSSTKPRDIMRQIYDRAQELVQRGIAQGVLRDADSDIYPTFLLSLFKGCMLRRLYYARDIEWNGAARVDQIVRFFMKGAGA